MIAVMDEMVEMRRKMGKLSDLSPSLVRIALLARKIEWLAWSVHDQEFPSVE